MAEATDTVMPFGKYEGRTLGDIAEHDPLYIDWLSGLNDLRQPLADAVQEVADQYEAEIESALEDD